jgi:hypothetical protein
MTNKLKEALGRIGTGMFGGTVVVVNLGNGFKPPVVWYILFGSLALILMSVYKKNR